MTIDRHKNVSFYEEYIYIYKYIIVFVFYDRQFKIIIFKITSIKSINIQIK